MLPGNTKRLRRKNYLFRKNHLLYFYPVYMCVRVHTARHDDILHIYLNVYVCMCTYTARHDGILHIYLIYLYSLHSYFCLTHFLLIIFSVCKTCHGTCSSSCYSWRSTWKIIICSMCRSTQNNTSCIHSSQ